MGRMGSSIYRHFVPVMNLSRKESIEKSLRYRDDRRFAVKRYIERVFANSNRWRELAQYAFEQIEPIARAYSVTENEVKLMHHIFSWHFNGTFKFPIIAGRRLKSKQ
jgi:hypothetical protein